MAPTIVKDELYGTIVLSELEKKIIDTGDFQRLRRIKQMVLTHLVYPCATHTRFEHSLGTMHVASLMSDQLGVEKEEKEKIRIYALLHDIGHGAFSHEGERILLPYLGTHEKNCGEKILYGEIGEIIAENYSPKKIVALEKTKEGQIVNSDIGADRIDYLRRDAQNTGVAYGVIDSDRIIHTVQMMGDELVIDESGLISAESLLIARFLMFSSVYFHHTVRIASAMLCRAIGYGLKDKIIEPKEFLEKGDDEVFLKLGESENAREYINAIFQRKLFKEAISVDCVKIKQENAPLLEQTLSERFDCDIIIDWPYDFFKSISVKVKTSESSKPVDLIKLSELVKSLKISEEKRKRVLVLCPAEKREKIKKTLEKEADEIFT